MTRFKPGERIEFNGELGTVIAMVKRPQWINGTKSMYWQVQFRLDAGGEYERGPDNPALKSLGRANRSRLMD